MVEQGTRSGPRAWGVVAVLCGMFASALLQTLLVTALPRISEELGEPQWYAWVISSYMILAVIAIPFFGPLADRVGVRPVFLFGLAVYAVGTVLVAAAPTMPALVAARGLQGLGSGAIVPAALASIGLLLRDSRGRGRAFGAAGAVQVIANVIGPPLGGWFAEGPGWRGGVLVVVPVILVAGLAARVGMPAPPSAGPRWWVINPLETFRDLRDPVLARIVGGAALVGAFTFGMLTWFPVLLQGVLGVAPTRSGLLMTPMMVAMGLGAATAGVLGVRRGALAAAWVLGVGGALTISVDSIGLAIGGSVAVGFAGGAILPVLLMRVQMAAPVDRLGSVSGLLQLGRTSGGALGVPLLGLWVMSPLSLSTAVSGIFVSLAIICLAGLLLTFSIRRR